MKKIIAIIGLSENTGEASDLSTRCVRLALDMVSHKFMPPGTGIQEFSSRIIADLKSDAGNTVIDRLNFYFREVKEAIEIGIEGIFAKSRLSGTAGDEIKKLALEEATSLFCDFYAPTIVSKSSRIYRRLD